MLKQVDKVEIKLKKKNFFATRLFSKLTDFFFDWLFTLDCLFVYFLVCLFVNASSDGMSEVMGNVVCLSHQHKKKHESQKRNFSKGAEILNQIILTNFQVFGNVVKHSVSLLINDVKHRASKQDTTTSKTALTFKTWENN